MIFLSLKNTCTFLLAKENSWKSIFNTNSELSQNRTEKQIMLLKTTVNWLFNDIWSYLVIGCFDWKIGVFQQTVVRFYYILKGCVRYIFASLILGLHESTCQIKKNVFYFTSKSLFVLEKIKFQYSTFSNFMTSSNALA